MAVMADSEERSYLPNSRDLTGGVYARRAAKPQRQNTTTLEPNNNAPRGFAARGVQVDSRTCGRLLVVLLLAGGGLVLFERHAAVLVLVHLLEAAFGLAGVLGAFLELFQGQLAVAVLVQRLEASLGLAGVLGKRQVSRRRSMRCSVAGGIRRFQSGPNARSNPSWGAVARRM